MFGLKELFLLNAISHKKSQKRKNQTTNKKKTKNQNQAYRRVDLDLDECPQGPTSIQILLGLGLCEWGDDFWAKEG